MPEETVPSGFSTKRLVLGAAVAAGSYYVLTRSYDYVKKMPLRQSIAQQREKRQRSIDIVKSQFEQTPADTRTEIAGYNYEQLIDQLRNRRITVVMVLHTYQQLALNVHERSNCITEFIIEAEQVASEWDKRVAQLNANQIYDEYPMLGVPFSVKESIQYKNYTSTNGIACRLQDLSENTCVNVALLEKAGAIAFVRTNVPQTLFSFGCSNPIYGCTTNPHNPARTSGGSSGGDACLVGAKAAVFGIGTDIAGSIRLPSHFSGTFGIKPTSGRTSNLFVGASNPGRAFIFGASGPLSVEAQVLIDVMKTLLSRDEMFKIDGTIAWQKWSEEPINKRLRIGVIATFAYAPAVPAITRAIDIVKDTITNKLNDKFEIVPFEFPDIDKVWGWVLSAALTDAGKHIVDMINEDIANEDDTEFLKLLGMNRTLRHVHLNLINDPRARDAYDALPQTTTELRDVYAQLAAYKRKVISLWHKSQLDLVLMPVCSSVAVEPQLQMQMIPAFTYTAMFNLLDMPAAVLPVTKVNQNDVDQFNKVYPQNDKFDMLMARCNGTSQAIGLPAGVQLIGLPYQEELVLNAVKLIDDSLH